MKIEMSPKSFVFLAAVCFLVLICLNSVVYMFTHPKETSQARAPIEWKTVANQPLGLAAIFNTDTAAQRLIVLVGNSTACEWQREIINKGARRGNINPTTAWVMYTTDDDPLLNASLGSHCSVLYIDRAQSPTPVRVCEINDQDCNNDLLFMVRRGQHPFN